MTEAAGLNQPAWCGFCPESGVYQRSFSNAAAISADLHRESTISIVTRDGDRVTLFSARDIGLTYSRTGMVEASAESLSWSGTESIAYSSRQELSFAVEGELSPEEMKDVQKALQLIDRIIRSALAGDVGAIVQGAQSSGGIGSLASVEAHLTIQSSVSQLQQVTSSATSGLAAVPGEPADPAMAAASGGTGLKPAQPFASSAEATAAAMTQAVVNSSCPPKALFQPVDRLLSRYAKMLAAQKRHPAADLLRLSAIREAFREKTGLEREKQNLEGS